MEAQSRIMGERGEGRRGEEGEKRRKERKERKGETRGREWSGGDRDGDG